MQTKLTLAIYMKRINSLGSINILALSMIIVSLIAVGAIFFGIWAFSNEQKYKNNANSLIASAVQSEKAKEASIKNAQFQIENQNPYTTYYGPQIYGSVHLSYPKDWSGYVDATGNGGAEVMGYFMPGVVPGLGASGNLYALRLEISSNSYSSNLANYTNQQSSNNLSITPYKLPKTPTVVGVMIQGQLQSNKTGVMVMLPLRTSTLMIWTDSMQYANLFKNNILPLVSYSP